MIGVGDRIEIWDQAKWLAYDEETAEKFSDLDAAPQPDERRSRAKNRTADPQDEVSVPLSPDVPGALPRFQTRHHLPRERA